LGLDRPQGALVTDVQEGSPAAEAGLQPGDVVLVVDGIRIEHPDALAYRIATRRIGEVAEFEVLQRGRNVHVTVNLAKAPEGESGKRITLEGQSPFAGCTVAELSPALSRRLGLPDNAR